MVQSEANNKLQKRQQITQKLLHILQHSPSPQMRNLKLRNNKQKTLKNKNSVELMRKPTKQIDNNDSVYADLVENISAVWV